ncbi:hypothetical protein [Mesorhizobium sp. SP-1A]|uniref:hypothetical protein n=1 Tax=Mesorhizobium sp. SP-1A TaxID=3077840 RepID=UPI0028F6D5E7|nr:hypothetical protein [Mesorhizobium sp. SP-1A]
MDQKSLPATASAVAERSERRDCTLRPSAANLFDTKSRFATHEGRTPDRANGTRPFDRTLSGNAVCAGRKFLVFREAAHRITPGDDEPGSGQILIAADIRYRLDAAPPRVFSTRLKTDSPGNGANRFPGYSGISF